MGAAAQTYASFISRPLPRWPDSFQRIALADVLMSLAVVHLAIVLRVNKEAMARIQERPFLQDEKLRQIARLCDLRLS